MIQLKDKDIEKFYPIEVTELTLARQRNQKAPGFCMVEQSYYEEERHYLHFYKIKIDVIFT